MVQVRTNINPGFLQDFATKSLISEILYYNAEKVENFTIIENHRAAYGCCAYQILEVSKKDAEKIERCLNNINIESF